MSDHEINVKGYDQSKVMITSIANQYEQGMSGSFYIAYKYFHPGTTSLVIIMTKLWSDILTLF